MTVRECAIVEAFTGVCMTAGDNRKYFYEYLQEILKRPVFTHELAKREVWEEIKNASMKDFLKLCRTADEPCERYSHEKAILEQIESGKGLQPIEPDKHSTGFFQMYGDI